MKRISTVILSLLLIILVQSNAKAALYSEIAAMKSSVDLGLSGGSACLMDSSTGEVLYEHNAHERLEPASVTKIMTLLIAMEKLEDGSITLDTKICASKTASEMGGSQIWLEYGEEMSLDDMLKAIAVVSANDCTVALAEHIAGSEEAFVDIMNKKASELGMKNTCFKNSTGLPQDGHYTSAYDIALMTRELSRHKTIFDYTTIWMDSLRNGEMGLSNTNKLIRFYKGATGMKTGYTSSAHYCLSATASRNNLDLIAAVMNCETSDDRFEDAKKLLDYGFANFATYTSEKKTLDAPEVIGGVKNKVSITYDPLTILLPKNKTTKVNESIIIPEKVAAPIKVGDTIGEIIYTIEGETVGKTIVFATEDVKKAGYTDILSKIFKKLIMLE